MDKASSDFGHKIRRKYLQDRKPRTNFCVFVICFVCRLGGWLGLGCLGLVGFALPGLGQFGLGSPGRVGLDWLWVGLAQLGLT